jgi:hypothetical protein
MKAELILIDGTKKKVNISTFDEARQLVCNFGYNAPLEMIYLHNSKALLIDEEGKLKNLEMNSKATQIAHEEEGIYPSDYICGDVILIDDVDEFDALPFE